MMLRSVPWPSVSTTTTTITTPSPRAARATLSPHSLPRLLRRRPGGGPRCKSLLEEDLKTEEVPIRRCSPFLESDLLSRNGVLTSDEWKTVPDIWRSSAEKFGDRIALVDPYHNPPTTMTYKQVEQEILDFSEGLRVIGVKPDEKISLFAENSCRWLVADQGLMATGAINVVRGSRSKVDELLLIYTHSESVALVVDSPELFNEMAGTFCSTTGIGFIILLWGNKSSLDRGVEEIPVYSYKEIIDLGRESRSGLFGSHKAGNNYLYEAIDSDHIATLVYSSGTTGSPKGVMLTHRNLLHQINNLWDAAHIVPGEKAVSMLPPWHVYERAIEYFLFSRGIELLYTTVRNLKDDLVRCQPPYMVSVPLVFETLYSGIQKQIDRSSIARKLVARVLISVSLAYMEQKRIYTGTCLTRNKEQPSRFASFLDWLWARTFAAILWPLHMLAKRLVYSKIQSAIGMSKAGISGGGSLPLHVDKFFEAIGVTVQNGYGLTETSPVVACRRPASARNVIGSVGHPLRHTQIKIVDSETGEALPAGSKGIVMVKGPQVMRGYYKNPSTTKLVLGDDGWLDTGDIGWIAPRHSIGRSRLCGGLLVLAGRAKDTIVLSTGENVEPLELEEAAMRSSLFLHIVVIGQDQRRVGAIIVPNKEEVLVAARRLSVVDFTASEISRGEMVGLLCSELRTRTSKCTFQVGPVLVVDEPFTVDNGLMTPTMKIRRDRVVKKYSEQIAQLYNK